MSIWKVRFRDSDADILVEADSLGMKDKMYILYKGGDILLQVQSDIMLYIGRNDLMKATMKAAVQV